MKRPAPTWKQRLYRQTPRYVTLAGYLLGFLILGAAVASWFVQTSIYSQATVVVEPNAVPVSLPQTALVLSELRKHGDRVARDDKLLEVSTDPRLVAMRIVRDVAETGIGQLSHLSGNSAPDELAALKRLAGPEVSTSAPRAVNSPIEGWLLTRSQAEGDNAMIVPAGEALVNVGDLSRITVRVEAVTDHAPTVRKGERVPLLLGEYDSKDLPAMLEDVQTTLTVEVPRTELSEERWVSLSLAGAVAVRMLGGQGQARVTPGKETAQIAADTAQFAGDGLTRARASKPVTVMIVAADGETVRGKLGMFRSTLVLSPKQDELTPRVREALMVRLGMGTAAIPVESCWVKVSTRSLFDRLFGK